MTLPNHGINPFALDAAESLQICNPKVAPCPRETKDVQPAIVSLAKAVGFEVYSMSQYRASHVAEGIPDLKMLHRRRAFGLWWETKTYYSGPWQKGILELKPLSEKQAEFRANAIACGEPHGWGALPDFYSTLLLVGLADRRSGVIMLRPR